MKRGFNLLLILLLVPIASAISVNMDENFQPGETLLASIEGNFLTQLTPENIYFYSERVSLPILFDIARVNDKYYIYALLPLQERNCALIIKNAHYLENQQEYKKDIEKNFSVSGNITDFSVYPGFIITKNNFTLALESKNSALDISVQVLNQSSQIHLKASESKKASFNVQSDNFTISSISVSGKSTSYSIPIAILSSTKPYSINISESKKFRFSDSSLILIFKKGSPETQKIYLINVGNEKIENIKISFDGNIKNIASVSLSDLSLESSESKEIPISISSSQPGIFYGTLKAESGNFTALSEITANITEEAANQVPQDKKEPCIVYGGAICQSSQECKTETVESLEGDCCLSSCGEKTSYASTIIGILIILAIAVGLFFLYKRYKKTKSPSSEDIIKKQSGEFEKRFETRGRLSRS